MIISKELMCELMVKLGVLLDNVVSNKDKYKSYFLVVDGCTLKIKEYSALTLDDIIVIGLELSIIEDNNTLDNIEELKNIYLSTLLNRLIML